MEGAIADENTRFGAKFEFMFILGSKVRPARATKDFEHGIIRWCIEQTSYWREIVKDTSGKPIYKKCGCEKKPHPKI